MDKSLVRDLEIAAAKVRIGIIEGVHSAKAGHPGGSLSCADLLTYLYLHRLNVDPADPKMESRDRMVLSKGHAAPALYAVLALRGFFSMEEMKTLRKIDSRMQGHPDSLKIPGVDASTGSLGQGISAACGMAFSGKLSDESYKVYTLLGDGELQEGEVMSPYPIDQKFEAFGWHTITINGHDFNEMEKAFDDAERVVQRPTVIIMKTTKGKGVFYMENALEWHGKAPNDEEYEVAMKELTAHLAELEG